MKIKGCLLVRPPMMLNAKSSKNFLSPDQNWANFGSFGGLGVRGFKKLRFLLQKARPCVNPRRLSHVASKSVEGCDLQVGSGRKNPESHRAYHRKDMSPLTQGLNYRSACDSSAFIYDTFLRTISCSIKTLTMKTLPGALQGARG